MKVGGTFLILFFIHIYKHFKKYLQIFTWSKIFFFCGDFAYWTTFLKDTKEQCKQNTRKPWLGDFAYQ